MWTASEYLKQIPPRNVKFILVHMAQVWRYHNLKPKGLIVDLRA